MKKLLAILVIAGGMTACNNASDSAASSVDSTTKAATDTIKAMADTAKKTIDSTAHAAVDSVKSKADSVKKVIKK